MNFFQLRDQWALNAPALSKDRLESLRQMDRQLNPHNDNYKPELRNEAELTSDEAYKFADGVLMRAYPNEYKDWLRKYFEERPHYRGWRPKFQTEHPTGDFNA